mgnify:CR=1 FL=1
MGDIVVLLDELHRLRDEIVAELASLTDEELRAQTEDVPWRIQHLLYRFSAHEEEHINQIIAARWAIGANPSPAQLILSQFLATRGRLEGTLISLKDEQAILSPREGEWSIIEILQHLLESDRQYLAWIRHNRAVGG